MQTIIISCACCVRMQRLLTLPPMPEKWYVLWFLFDFSKQNMCDQSKGRINVIAGSTHLLQITLHNAYQIEFSFISLKYNTPSIRISCRECHIYKFASVCKTDRHIVAEWQKALIYSQQKILCTGFHSRCLTSISLPTNLFSIPNPISVVNNQQRK